MSSSDADKLKLYQEAKKLLAGLPSSAYPDRELQWLVTTCWNRGAHQAKFQRCEAAEQYMRLALALLDHCHSLSARKQVGACSSGNCLCKRCRASRLSLFMSSSQ